MPGNAAQSPNPAASVKEVTVQNFMQEVIQASLQLPVLVYFTAAWCGPCKQFGPLLEKVVGETKGRVKLARVDIDKNPQLAQQFRVQSVPMVYIFLQGQPLDAFAGALPESQLRQMLTQLLGSMPQDESVKATVEMAAQLLAEGNAEAAQEAYQALLAEDEGNPDALAGLAKCLIAQGHLNKAKQTLAQLPADKQGHEAVAAALAALKLAEAAPRDADTASLHKKLTANPLDHQARFELASALFAAGRQEEAINELLFIIAKDKEWNEGTARRHLLTFFEALGHTHPLTMQGRRRLSSLLFA